MVFGLGFGLRLVSGIFGIHKSRPQRSLKGNLCYHNKEITRENKRRRQREISFDLIAQSK